MRNYQRQKNNPYRLPHNLYMRMLYLIRDYERLKDERREIMHGSPANDGIPCAGIGNPTENKAIRIAIIDSKCEAIDRALSEIPFEYRADILRNIENSTPYPPNAGEATYRRWKSRFIFKVAKNLHEI